MGGEIPPPFCLIWPPDQRRIRPSASKSEQSQERTKLLVARLINFLTTLLPDWLWRKGKMAIVWTDISAVSDYEAITNSMNPHLYLWGNDLQVVHWNEPTPGWVRLSYQADGSMLFTDVHRTGHTVRLLDCDKLYVRDQLFWDQDVTPPKTHTHPP